MESLGVFLYGGTPLHRKLTVRTMLKRSPQEYEINLIDDCSHHKDAFQKILVGVLR